MKHKTGTKALSWLLSLAMLFSLVPGMGLTALAADEVSENISLVNGQSLVLGTHYSVSGEFENESGIHVYNKGPMTINARKGETITKVVLTYSWGNNKSSLSASPGTFDGNATISDINAQQVTISSSHAAGVKISAVTVYFEGSLSNPTVTLTGGANAKSSGGLLTQSYLPGAMDTVTYTALTGAAFPEFETFTQNGVTVERTSDTVVTISGTPTANTEITVPDAESSSKMVTWGSSIINDSGRNGLEYQIRRNNSYSDTANGITLTKSGSGNVGSDWYTYGSLELNFTTATGKFTSIEIETSQIRDGGNWTKDGNTLKWNGTPSNSVSLSGSSLYLEGVSSINFVIEMPTVSVTITPGSNMTKTTDSGAASQTDLSGAMTDVVYTADDGYYFPEDYSVAAVNGISVTRNSYTQITVSGIPTAAAAITLTAPTAKTTPDAPTTAAATDCTTADNNDGKLTGVTTAMEYKKSDAENWTAGTGSDITGLVPGTYYVRVKATETKNASTNQELTIKGFISYTVTFKVVNGKWNEGEGDAATADKTVTLTGHDGDTLKLTADQIPAVGTKPNDTYKAGSWDTTPSAETEITGATTYTYTYAQKEAATVTKAPEAKTLTYNGQAQELVTAGTATGGEMQYALGNATEATQPYTTSIPTATDAGTYYVWYKAVGSDGDSAAAYVTVTVSSRPTPSSSSSSDSDSSSSTPSSTTTTTTTTDTTSNPDASTTDGTATVTTTTNRDGSTTERTTETATKSGGDGSKTEVKAESTTTTKSNRNGTTTAATTTTETATTTAADGTKTVTETKTEAKETLDKSGNGTVEAKTTETVKDASGKVTATTVTESKGTVETATDGTKTTTTTNTAVTTDAAGNKTTVVTTEKATVTTDGNTGKVVSDESGKVVSVEAKISETAAESAAKSGETVTLPVTVTAAQSAEDATPVAITVPKAAESVKVEIPVEDVKPGTVAVIVHEDGTEEIVKTSTTSEGGVVLALESGASVKVVDNTKTFDDVDGSEWYADNVTWASSREVMNGVGNNTFAPNEVTTTGMVAQILMNLSGETANPNTAAEKYSDIKANDWFAAPISWLTEAGIAQGKGDAFGATEAITRERDIVLLHNYAQHMGYDTSARADLNRFADAGSVSDWARDAMAWAVGAGIINGTTDGSRNVVLDPQGSATRAQVTAMTERFCKKTAR